MGHADYLKLGECNAICYECGKKFKLSELKKHWQGYWVCESHWEARHPQDFVKGVADVQAPPWTRPEPAAEYIPFCTPAGLTALPDVAVAGCAIADFRSPAYDPAITY